MIDAPRLRRPPWPGTVRATCLVTCALAVGSCAPRELAPAAPAPASAPRGSAPERQTRILATLPAPPPPTVASAAPAPNTGDEAGDPFYQAEGEEAPADDVPEADEEAPADSTPAASPLDGLSEKQIEDALTRDPASFGSMSIGQPGAGALFNGVQMPAGEHWVLEDPAHAWGTQETVDYLTRAIDAVCEKFPDTPPMYIGHISARRGGHLSPHISHQAGRDVDVSYYYLDGARWYARATAKNLDRARTWAFVRALVTRTDVQLILMDQSVQKLVKEYALSAGEKPEWLDSLFHGRPGKQRPIIIHVPGHATHIHVRFFNPVAQETGRRAYHALVARGLLQPPTRYLTHTVKKGETLGMLARKYHTTVAAIRQANDMHKNLIRPRQIVRIPKKGGTRAPVRVAVPGRRTPSR